MIHAIIPVYNVEPYIQDFLKTLIGQTYADIRFVIIDDGSTDMSGEICREYAFKDNRIHLLEQHNSGVSAARNRGMEYVEKTSKSGDYMLFFDPDDYLTSNHAIEDIAVELGNLDIDLLIYNYNINNRLKTNSINRGGVLVEDQIDKVLFPWVLFGKKYNGIALSGSLFGSAFSIDIIKNNQLRFREDIRKAEDTLFYARYLGFVKTVKLSTIVPYNYRIRPRSLTTTYRKPSLLGIEKGLSILEEFHECALQCQSVDKRLIETYFNRRYILMVINYVTTLVDKRTNYSRQEITDEINRLYSLSSLQQIIDSLIIEWYELRLRFELAMVKSRRFLPLYCRAVALIKNTYRKFRHK